MTRATPIIRRDPIPPLYEPQRFRFIHIPDPEEKLRAMQAQIERLKMKQARIEEENRVAPVPPAKDMEPPMSTRELYAECLRVLGVSALDFASEARGRVKNSMAWWPKAKLHEIRSVVFALLRSHAAPSGPPSFPEIAKLCGRRSHTTVMNSIDRWSADDAMVDRTLKLASAVGLGDAGALRVLALQADRRKNLQNRGKTS